MYAMQDFILKLCWPCRPLQLCLLPSEVFENQLSDSDVAKKYIPLRPIKFPTITYIRYNQLQCPTIFELCQTQTPGVWRLLLSTQI